MIAYAYERNVTVYIYVTMLLCWFNVCKFLRFIRLLWDAPVDVGCSHVYLYVRCHVYSITFALGSRYEWSWHCSVMCTGGADMTRVSRFEASVPIGFGRTAQ